jgi:hypothetical protein
MRVRRLAVGALLHLTATACGALTFCIDVGGTCDISASGAAAFQASLNAAAASSDADTIRLGVATYVGPFIYQPVATAGTLAIVGAGVDQTVVTAPAPSTNFVDVLSLRRDLVGNPATVSLLTVVVPTPSGSGGATGVSTDGILEDLRVTTAPGVNGSRLGVNLLGLGSGVRRSVIEMANTGAAVETDPGSTVTQDSSPAFLEDSSALEGRITIEAFAPMRVSRARISSRGNRTLVARGTTVTVEDTLMLVDNGASGPSAQPQGSPGVLHVRHVTVVNVGAIPAFAAMDVDSSAGGLAQMDVSHSIFVGFEHGTFRRAATGATATLAVSASIFRRDNDIVEGDGDTTLSEPQANLDVDPLLTADFHLQDGSPAIDAAFSPALGASESPTDLDGAPRIQDGNGDGIAARDMGAFEHAAVPLVSTTTTTLPGCADEVAFESVRCRLAALAEAVPQAVPGGALASKLVGLLARATEGVTAAETARLAGQTKPARKALGKAAKALAGFGKRLKSRAAAGLDPAARSALAASAGAIRDDVRALRAL